MGAPAPRFGTNGIRGTLENITPDFIAQISASFATWAYAGGRSGQVLVGRDTRTTGELVESAVASGLLWAGAQPVVLGVVPSPAVEYIGSKRGLPSIMITASHNPPEWVALKFNDANGLCLSKERGAEVERICAEGVWARARWDQMRPIIRDYEAINEYRAAIMQGCGPLNGIKVVLDCGNGTAGRVAIPAFKELGADVVPLNEVEDGRFPGRHSEPTEANVQGLIAKVKECGADMGIAYDGDADRVALVDENGKYVIGDKVFALAADIILSEDSGDVVTTVATSSLIMDVARKHGRNVKLVKVGAPYIAEEMAKGGYATGGEEVGGVIWPKVHPGKDGIMTSLRVACWLKRNGKVLSEVVGALPKYYNVKKKIAMGRERLEVIAKLQQKYSGAPNATVVDGVRLDFEDGWCIARASGTEDYVRVMGEAKSEARAHELVGMLEQEVLALSK
ncbi:MAG: phosphoglucosamine mutase [Candidatus Micrarchaeia archaeon]